MNNLAVLSIGVIDYRFVLEKKCANDPTNAIHACLSFGLSGDFLPAARSDALSDTVDYDSLCKHLKVVLKDADCQDPQAMAATAKRAIRDFSPLISGGYINIAIQCHDTFLVEQHLL